MVPVTDGSGREATTEKCGGDVPAAGTGDAENIGANGMIEVDVPESAVDLELLRAEGLDRGIFEVMKARRGR